MSHNRRTFLCWWNIWLQVSSFSCRDYIWVVYVSGIIFFFIGGLLDCKGWLNCYHMLSLCTITDLMWVCCFLDFVCGECVWERGKETDTQWQRREIKKKCICVPGYSIWVFFQMGETLNPIGNYWYTVTSKSIQTISLFAHTIVLFILNCKWIQL